MSDESEEFEIVPIEVVIRALETTWADRLKLGSKRRLTNQVPAGELARSLAEVALAEIPQAHPLRRPAEGLLAAIADEARALDSLWDTKPAMKHARAMEEATVTLEYLISQPARHEEFRWRWDAFNHLFHARLLLRDKERIEFAPAVAWMSEHRDKLMRWFGFKGDIVSERKLWRRIHHWLFPASIKDIFEAVDKLDRYEFSSYAMNSHLVHVSPAANMVFGVVKADEGVTFQSIFGSSHTLLAELARTVEPLAIHPERVRRERLSLVVRYLFGLARDQPRRLARLSRESRAMRAMIDQVLRPDFDAQFFEDLVLGRKTSAPGGETTADV